MKTIDEMTFYVRTTSNRRKGCRYTGHVREFSELRTGPKTTGMDAISEIIELTSERLQDLDEDRAMTVNGGRPA